jgi:hypothetical protein
MGAKLLEGINAGLMELISSRKKDTSPESLMHMFYHEALFTVNQILVPYT